ncbi:MAG: membrane protein [Parcubacteria group bacterium Athens0416_74]|nr:MAG: membrane protein [Parcubacteria group bacterium Athens0416_74]
MDGIHTLLSYVDVWEVFRYGIVGAVSAVLFWKVFVYLYERRGLHYRLSQVIAFPPAFVLNFALHKVWTFAAAGVWYEELFKFSLKKLAFLLLNLACMHILVEGLRLRPRHAQLILILTLGPLGFLVVKLAVFAR